MVDRCSVTLIGIDPDEAIRRRARTKLAGVTPPVELLAGYARDSADLLRGRGVTKVLSSLMFHQVPLEEKRAGLSAIYAALSSVGRFARRGLWLATHSPDAPEVPDGPEG